jgi:hypothetical protein
MAVDAMGGAKNFSKLVSPLGQDVELILAFLFQASEFHFVFGLFRFKRTGLPGSGVDLQIQRAQFLLFMLMFRSRVGKHLLQCANFDLEIDQPRGGFLLVQIRRGIILGKRGFSADQ